jgi:hypothetical protein
VTWCALWDDFVALEISHEEGAVADIALLTLFSWNATSVLWCSQYHALPSRECLDSPRSSPVWKSLEREVSLLIWNTFFSKLMCSLRMTLRAAAQPWNTRTFVSIFSPWALYFWSEWTGWI